MSLTLQAINFNYVTNTFFFYNTHVSVKLTVVKKIKLYFSYFRAGLKFDAIKEISQGISFYLSEHHFIKMLLISEELALRSD
jgi:hypothetical protein